MSTKDGRDRVALLQGTLDLLILQTLRAGPTHGHAIVKAIERTSDDVLLVEQGSLYPALHRLIKRKWIVHRHWGAGRLLTCRQYSERVGATWSWRLR